jgi:DNA-binding NarL/FixJ family response regulator
MRVAEEAGWYQCDHRDSCGCVVVTDRLDHPATAKILVVREQPAQCQDALSAVTSGRARAVLMWDGPEDLLGVLEVLHHDALFLPRRLVELASSGPALTSRQRSTLRLMALGRSNHAIATTHCQSLSTAKRDIAELFALFDVSNRSSLLTAANACGFV